jgi:photosynthetic reaction center cytochrome c subunit
MNVKRRGTILRAMGTMVVSLVSLVSAGAQAGQTPRPQMSEEAFKDVRVLKGIPVDEFMDTMGMFAAALGFCCTDCHVKEAVGNMAAFAEPTPKINQARGMIAMTNTLNRNSFAGAKKVTCYTCHRGTYAPETVPDLAQQYSEPYENPNVPEVANSPASPQPIFDKYIQALGGAQRLANFAGFTATGTYSGYETGLGPVPLEVYAKAPNQRTLVLKMPEEDAIRVYDGTNGWAVGPERPVPLTTLTGPNLIGARLDAIVSFPTGIQREFTQWKTGSTVIKDREVAVAQGTKAGQAYPVNFYFDAETGLLVRMVRWNDTAVGPVATEVDYDDYRDVAGVKVPFHMQMLWTGGNSTIELSEVRPTVPDAARFARPAPGRQR